jgi:quinol monooxygenase YgiN
MKFLALITGVFLMTTAPVLANDYPPFIPAPKDATPVMVIVELMANDPKVLERHLVSAGVIPVTRLASGINYSWTIRDQGNPKRFLLVQQWNSVAQQQGYIAWRNQRGNLAQLRALLSQDPVVRYLDPIDMTALPAQIRQPK